MSVVFYFKWGGLEKVSKGIKIILQAFIYCLMKIKRFLSFDIHTENLLYQY